jgi:hypothetical protein
MPTDEGPKGARAKRFASVTDPEASATTASGAAAAAATATGGATTMTTATQPSAPTIGGLPVMGQRISDEETRQQLEMAAESDLEAARYTHWRGTVTFHDVATAWFNMADPNLPDDLRGEFKAIFPGLLDAFAEPRKGIVTAYFCRHIRVAAVLTDIGHAAGAPEGVPESSLKGPPPAGIKDILDQTQQDGHGEPSGQAMRLETRRRMPWYRRCIHFFDPAPASSSAIHIEPTFGDPADWKAKEILFHCLHLHYKALEFLTPQPRKICMRMIFGVIATLLGTLDQRQLDMITGKTDKPFGSDPKEIETLERELGEAGRYYRQSAQRQAQLEYLVGMLTFLVLAAVATAIVAIAAGALDTPAMLSVLGGATGAVVSVLSRMSSGNLKLNAESGKKTIRALGFMRPVIGAVFGAVVYLFLDGGIVDVLAPPTNGSHLAFYAGLGFLSGFSERFAQDVIEQATPKTPQPPDTGHLPAHP